MTAINIGIIRAYRVVSLHTGVNHIDIDTFTSGLLIDIVPAIPI
jgi:hypothetical protein